MPDTLLTDTLVFILAAVVSVGVLTRIGLPVVLGYLAAGLVIGPHGLHMLAAGDGTMFLAELGVVLLMFMVGLDFSLPRLIKSRRAVLGGGGLQVGLTVLAVAGGARILGVDWRAAVVLAGAAAMSSTAIALKQLSDQGELETEHGRRAMSVLLFQDLATLPFLVILGAWERHAAVSAALPHLAVAASALALAALTARPILRGALAWVVQRKSEDLFLLSTLLLALGTAFAANAVGLPLSIGAFLAGMVIGESDFRHQIADDIRPFRDVLLGLFFVTVGMEVDPSVVVLSPWLVLAWTALLVPGKALLVWTTAKLMRWPSPSSVRLAAILAHGGEFGLLLLTQGIAGGVIGARIAQPALFAIVVTMTLAPVLIQHSGRFERGLALLLGWGIDDGGAGPARDAGDLEAHVLICGCGRVGRLVAVALEEAKVAYVAIESDIASVREARDRGHRVRFGDAARKAILDAAGLARCKLVVVTFDRSPAVDRVLHFVRAAEPSIRTLVSSRDERKIAALAALGATVVFPENLAAGLALAQQALLQSGLAQEATASVITAVRARLNPEMRDRVGL